MVNCNEHAGTKEACLGEESRLNPLKDIGKKILCDWNGARTQNPKCMSKFDVIKDTFVDGLETFLENTVDDYLEGRGIKKGEDIKDMILGILEDPDLEPEDPERRPGSVDEYIERQWDKLVDSGRVKTLISKVLEDSDGNPHNGTIEQYLLNILKHEQFPPTNVPPANGPVGDQLGSITRLVIMRILNEQLSSCPKDCSVYSYFKDCDDDQDECTNTNIISSCIKNGTAFMSNKNNISQYYKPEEEDFCRSSAGVKTEHVNKESSIIIDQAKNVLDNYINKLVSTCNSEDNNIKNSICYGYDNKGNWDNCLNKNKDGVEITNEYCSDNELHRGCVAKMVGESKCSEIYNDDACKKAGCLTIVSGELMHQQRAIVKDILHTIEFDKIKFLAICVMAVVIIILLTNLYQVMKSI